MPLATAPSRPPNSTIFDTGLSWRAPQSVSNARVVRLTNLVDLYVALGGGWLQQTDETPRPADAGTDYGSLPAQVPQGGASGVKGPAG